MGGGGVGSSWGGRMGVDGVRMGWVGIGVVGWVMVGCGVVEGWWVV